MYGCDLLRYHHIQGPKIQQRLMISSRYEDAFRTNGAIAVHVLYKGQLPGAKKAFVKGEALRLLGTNSSNQKNKKNITTFKKHLIQRGYPQNFINNTLSEEKFQERTQALLLQRNKAKKRMLPFVTQHHSSVPNLKEILTKKRYLTQQQPLLNQIFKEPLIISYRKGRSLKDILVRAKI